jgi:uncharacterized protein YbjT (DUF2867 family)
LFLRNLVHNQNIYFQPSGTPSPVYTGDLEKIVARVLSDKSVQGKSYLVSGPKPVTWNNYLQALEKATTRKALLNSSVLQKVS